MLIILRQEFLMEIYGIFSDIESYTLIVVLVLRKLQSLKYNLNDKNHNRLYIQTITSTERFFYRNLRSSAR